MVVTWIIMGLTVMAVVPLVSLYLFLMGLGGLINSVSSNEYEETDNGE